MYHHQVYIYDSSWLTWNDEEQEQRIKILSVFPPRSHSLTLFPLVLATFTFLLLIRARLFDALNGKRCIYEFLIIWSQIYEEKKDNGADEKTLYTLSLILNNSLKQSDGLTGNGAIISHTKIARFVFDSSIEFWCVQWIILEATLPLPPPPTHTPSLGNLSPLFPSNSCYVICPLLRVRWHFCIRTHR